MHFHRYLHQPGHRGHARHALQQAGEGTNLAHAVHQLRAFVLLRLHSNRIHPIGCALNPMQNKEDEAKFGMFDIAPYGVPYALMGFVFIILTQRFLLPGNSSRYAKDLLIAVRVLPSSPVVKKKLKDSGLRTQTGFSLAGLWRGGAMTRYGPTRNLVCARCAAACRAP